MMNIAARSFLVALAFLLCLLLSEVEAFSSCFLSSSKSSLKPLHAQGESVSDADKHSRRVFLSKVCITAATFFPVNGALAEEESDFIKELKGRSDANREEYRRQAGRSDKLSYGQFASQYDRPKFIGVRRLDGSYKMLTPEALEDLQAKGLVVAEYDNMTTKDGEVKVDYQKGKILQFPNAEAQAKVEKRSSSASAPVPAPEPTSEGVALASE